MMALVVIIIVCLLAYVGIGAIVGRIIPGTIGFMVNAAVMVGMFVWNITSYCGAYGYNLVEFVVEYPTATAGFLIGGAIMVAFDAIGYRLGRRARKSH